MLLRRGKAYLHVMIPQARSDSKQVFGVIVIETAEKEVQDTSCRGSGGVPKIGGYKGLIESISAVSL